MKREDVEAILRDVLESAKSAGVRLGDMTFSVEGDTLEALCRAWLALDGAVVVEMPSRPGPALQGASLVIGAAAAERMGLAGQRVRLVPEDGQGGGRG